MSTFNKQTIEKTLRDNNLLPSEMEDVFMAISEILHLAAEQMKIDSPYATNTIEQFKYVSFALDGAEDFINKYCTK